MDDYFGEIERINDNFDDRENIVREADLKNTKEQKDDEKSNETQTQKKED